MDQEVQDATADHLQVLTFVLTREERPEWSRKCVDDEKCGRTQSEMAVGGKS